MNGRNINNWQTWGNLGTQNLKSKVMWGFIKVSWEHIIMIVRLQ